MSDNGCDLEFPEKFFAATQFCADPPPYLVEALTDATRLLLYALYQQAIIGPNTTQKPWSWFGNNSATLRWQAWADLENMSRREAMEMYVGTVEEDCPRWWEMLTQQCNPDKVKEVSLQAAFSALQYVNDEDDEETMVGLEGEMESLAKQIVDGQVRESASKAPQDDKYVPIPPLFEDHETAKDIWAPVTTVGAPSTVPLPRQKHSSTIVREKMYVIGGSYGGRSLSDVQVLDLNSTAWNRLVIKNGVMPSIMGHRTVAWDDKLVIVGGKVKNEEASTMSIYLLTPATATVCLMDTYGIPPPSCASHGVALIRNRLYVFGGEEMDEGTSGKGRPLGDLYVLDLETKEWSQPACGGSPPPPRFGHAMDAFNDTLFVFGGTADRTAAFSDIHVLSLADYKWTKTVSQGATPPSWFDMSMCPISKASGAWALAGGQTPTATQKDMYVLAASFGQMLTWTKIDGGAPLFAGEGSSVVCGHNETDEQPSFLVIYGGYDGRYSKTAGVLELGPRIEAAAYPSSAASAMNALNAVFNNATEPKFNRNLPTGPVREDDPEPEPEPEPEAAEEAGAEEGAAAGAEAAAPVAPSEPPASPAQPAEEPAKEAKPVAAEKPKEEEAEKPKEKEQPKSPGPVAAEGVTNHIEQLSTSTPAGSVETVGASDDPQQEDLAQRAGEAAREAVREAAVLAAKGSARESAMKAAAPGAAAAAAVSSAVDAAAEMAYKQMLYAARVSERRLKECSQRIDCLEETKALMTEELASLHKKFNDVEARATTELQRVCASAELKETAITSQYEKALSDADSRFSRFQAEERIRYDKLAMVKETNEKKLEAELVKANAENFKLQAALKNMEELERRVERLTSAALEEDKVEASAEELISKMAGMIDQSAHPAVEEKKPEAPPSVLA